MLCNVILCVLASINLRSPAWGESFGASSCSSCSTIETLQKDSLRQVETLQKDKAFQDFLQNQAALLERNKFQETLVDLTKANDHFLPSSHSSGNLYIFVSFSLSEKALLNLARDARQWGATLVLRGFVEGSYKKTIRALQKIIQKTGKGFLIDPELFTLFSVQAVPTVILSKPFQLEAQERTQTPIHDRIQGHVSLSYALERFSKDGDCKHEAKILLRYAPSFPQGGLGRSSSVRYKGRGKQNDVF